MVEAFGTEVRQMKGGEQRILGAVESLAGSMTKQKDGHSGEQCVAHQETKYAIRIVSHYGTMVNVE
jgi:hypothetical protein